MKGYRTSIYRKYAAPALQRKKFKKWSVSWKVRLQANLEITDTTKVWNHSFHHQDMTVNVLLSTIGLF
ncbi:hypothetical protein [Bacillus sp. P14.5]|uniref:hypothetical protein n=1 Tax=Bacillus sp. P14.5 TaxID=1983400 RepID=UPI000DEB77A6|nr:hypothetical protein [Bacillus sp. P14.5]